MIRRLLLLTLAGAAGLFAYSWDAVIGTTSWSSAWQVNGDIVPQSPYYNLPFPAGSSMIYTAPVSGANPNDYEVQSTLASDGAVHFLRANSSTVQYGVGSYISVELAYSSSGVQIKVNQCVNGSVTTLYSTTNPTLPTVFRTAVWGTTLRVFFDQQWMFDTTIPLTTGYPGVGAGPIGAFYQSVRVGHHDTVASFPVNAEPVASSLLPNSVSLAWTPTTDDSPGIGMFGYQVSRTNSVLGTVVLGTVAEPTFADSSSALQPNTAYTYQISAEDQHGNLSTPLTLNVTTPPAQNVDPRRTGVRTSGSYWGGGGEQIDTLSGNLNFSFPLFTAMQRTGSKYPLALNYNSQNWSQTSGFNWQLGADLGYGFGWKLQFGSITPYYDQTWTGVDHYVFTDGTGADYRLDVNDNGIWSSSQSPYVSFDSNLDRLHFNDGSFWAMSCTSGGMEPDAGTMYPQTIEDVNGNQIIIRYRSAASLNNPYIYNSSGRIDSVYDSTGGVSSLTYNTDSPVPHVTNVSSSSGGPTNYTLYYSTSSLSPPFGSDSRYVGATTTFLASVAVPVIGNPYSFSDANQTTVA